MDLEADFCGPWLAGPEAGRLPCPRRDLAGPQPSMVAKEA